jgi:integrase
VLHIRRHVTRDAEVVGTKAGIGVVRYVPITPEILACIDPEVINLPKGEDYLVPWKYHYARKVIRRIHIAAGLPELGGETHYMRKTCSTKVIAKHGIETASVLLGHSSTAITEKFYWGHKESLLEKLM